jgi:hypothetical protein
MALLVSSVPLSLPIALGLPSCDQAVERAGHPFAQQREVGGCVVQVRLRQKLLQLGVLALQRPQPSGLHTSRPPKRLFQV